LLGEHRPEVQIARLRLDLYTERIGRDTGINELGLRGAEGHVANLDALEEFPVEPLIPQAEVVVDVELAFAIEIDVDIQPVRDDSSSPNLELGFDRRRRKSASASRTRVSYVRRGAPRIPQLIESQLEMGLGIQPQVRESRELCP
jgi:hypothetical protein